MASLQDMYVRLLLDRVQDENYPTVQALRLMDQLVTQRTEKRHSIRVFHSRQLGEESQTVEQTRVGAIDINRINVGAIGNAASARPDPIAVSLTRAVPDIFRVVPPTAVT